MPPPNHLARYRLADLFLDTLPYNAHTTASDALWAGLPVLTHTAAADFGSMSLLADFPELQGLNSQQLPVALNAIAASNPERHSQIRARIDSIQTMHNAAQQAKAQQEQIQQLRMAQWQLGEDQKFERVMAKVPDSERQNVVNNGGWMDASRPNVPIKV
jgi:predicted O-linked N-acetylglucosamine transferase (SPINDLY family)